MRPLSSDDPWELQEGRAHHQGGWEGLASLREAPQSLLGSPLSLWGDRSAARAGAAEQPRAPLWGACWRQRAKLASAQ